MGNEEHAEKGETEPPHSEIGFSSDDVESARARFEPRDPVHAMLTHLASLMAPQNPAVVSPRHQAVDPLELEHRKE